jgi:hypothetical protein
MRLVVVPLRSLLLVRIGVRVLQQQRHRLWRSRFGTAFGTAFGALPLALPIIRIVRIRIVQHQLRFLGTCITPADGHLHLHQTVGGGAVALLLQLELLILLLLPPAL